MASTPRPNTPPRGGTGGFFDPEPPGSEEYGTAPPRASGGKRVTDDEDAAFEGYRTDGQAAGRQQRREGPRH